MTTKLEHDQWTDNFILAKEHSPLYTVSPYHMQPKAKYPINWKVLWKELPHNWYMIIPPTSAAVR